MALFLCLRALANRTTFVHAPYLQSIMAAHREAIQKQVHQDWANREYIEVITASIKRITDFLNSFGTQLFNIVAYSQFTHYYLFRHVLSFKIGPAQ